MNNQSDNQKRMIDTYRRQAKGYDASGIRGLELWRKDSAGTKVGRAGHGLAGWLAVVVATWLIFLAVMGHHGRCDPTPSLANGLAGVGSTSCCGDKYVGKDKGNLVLIPGGNDLAACSL